MMVTKTHLRTGLKKVSDCKWLMNIRRCLPGSQGERLGKDIKQ